MELNSENPSKTSSASKPPIKNPARVLHKKVPLTTKKAVELLLGGTLKNKVCRYCLSISHPLSELDQILQIGGQGALYKVTIRDMVASFHPFKVMDDPNFPNKICNKCLTRATRSYLFAQQCEQAERALRNCMEDMFEKLEKLDPIERTKKRGRQKLNPNRNVLHAEHNLVMDYAEPIRNLINVGSVSLTKETEITDLECKRCWQVLPNVESLVNHEKMHPKSMWYHCRLCGKSFIKRFQMKRHLKYNHKHKDLLLPQEEEKGFACKECYHVSNTYELHLQHVEKHKFQTVFEHLVERNMDRLCAVCLDKGDLVELEKIICLHGGYPELTGDRSVYNILGSTVPEMNILHNYTGTKICKKCLDHAIISYVFINKVHYIRNRLDTCITKMLENLNQINDPENKIFIEISHNSIMPPVEVFDENLLLDDDEIDEVKLKVDILEDEFRLKSDSEESDDEPRNNNDNNKSNVGSKIDTKPKTNPTAKNLLNGFQTLNSANNVCSEFLTFKKKHYKQKPKYTCPMCNKHFISDYFLKKHILKHVNRKVQCESCCAQFKSKFYKNEHVKTVHSKDCKSYFSCRFCGRSFSDRNRTLSHEKCHNFKQCQLCTKTFMTQRHFNNHMQRHALKLNSLNQNTIQTCSFCEKSCANNNRLSIHVNKVHLQIKPYGCDMCEKQFYSETNLKCHKKIHSLKSNETCEFCKKTFKCRNDLVVHVRKHIGIKPYKCPICSLLFYSEIEVKKHMNKWHGGRFCCNQCKKVFVNRNVLKNHVNKAHSVF